MRITLHQLHAQLKQGLKPVYFLFGAEPYQKKEAADAIRTQALTQGIEDRERFDILMGFDWEHWYQLTQTRSLFSVFSEKRLFECHFSEELKINKTLGPLGAEKLCAFMQSPPDDIVLLITAPKLDASALASAWFKAIDKTGIILYTKPLSSSETSASVFDLVDAIFEGSIPKTKGIFFNLKQEAEAIFVLWALIKRIRTQPISTTFNRQRLLSKAQHIDNIIKGLAPGNAWDALYLFCLSLIGVSILDV
jgi:DNA polymerase III delta subunit